MTDTDYSRWKLEHATLFRFGDEDLKMMDLWRPAFESRGFEVAELLECTTHLAQSEPKTWRSEHLNFILKRVAWRRAVRSLEFAAEQDRQEEFTCRACDGSGVIVVPHPKSVRDGEWVHPWYECAVACSCRKGELLVERYRAINEIAKEQGKRETKPFVPSLLTKIGDYDMRNPDWQRQMKAKVQKQQAEREALAATARDDSRRGPLAKMVRQLVEKQA